MTTKFNQGMYAKMMGKKNKPLSNLEKRTVQVVEKGVSITPPASVTKPSRTASPALQWKKLRLSERSLTWTTRGRTRLIPIHPLFLTMLALR